MFFGYKSGGVLVGLLLFLCCLSACSSNSFAPVVQAMSTAKQRPGQYRVNRGDTIYSIAWAYGLDYRTLAAVNRVSADYQIQPGQMLNLRMPKQRVAARGSNRVVYYRPAVTKHRRHTAQKSSYTPKPASRWWQQNQSQPVRRWYWPARGVVASGFSRKLAGNKGINIAGHYGEPVLASAAGRVVYAGSGIRGYGNLIIIKHNASYLSAYAYNRRLLVKLGQRVKARQRIAMVGRNNAGQSLLHFEIRRNGRPVNPLQYLQ